MNAEITSKTETSKPGGPVLLLGAGYSARVFGARLASRGWRVAGTTRDPARAEDLRALGIEPIIGDLTAAAPALATARALLISAGPSAGGDPVLNALRDPIAERARAGGCDWIGYLSTTGVYGDHAGAWIDESAPRSPTTTRGEWRVAAEDAWSALHAETGAPVHIFRLAGIYGPGRGPFAKVRSGEARRIVKPGQVFSRIHVDDIASVLEASLARPDPGAAYNVCDDLPAPPEDVIAHAAELLALPIPPAVPFEEAELSPMARSFYSECKRTSNAKMKADLEIRLRFPDYRSGLADLLARQIG